MLLLLLTNNINGAWPFIRSGITASGAITTNGRTGMRRGRDATEYGMLL